jgi:hypothetical protein
VFNIDLLASRLNIGKRVDCRPSRDSRSHARLFRCKHRSWGSSYGRFVAGLADCRDRITRGAPRPCDGATSLCTRANAAPCRWSRLPCHNHE